MRDTLIVRGDDSNPQPLFFIEIKYLKVYTSLCVEGSATAQALREAHILCGSDRSLPLVLTNSQVWSFGLVKKRGTKIDVLEYFDIHIDEQPVGGQHGVKLILAALKSVLLGKWPHHESLKETGAGLGPAKETGAGLGPAKKTQAGLGPPMETEAGLGPAKETEAGLGPAKETEAGLRPAMERGCIVL